MAHGERTSLKFLFALIIFASVVVSISSAAPPGQNIIAPPSNPQTKSAQKKDPNEKIPVEVAGDKLEYLRDQEKVIAEGNVIVSYEGVSLTCDRVEVLTKENKAYAEGHVVLYRGQDVFRGDKVFYDFESSVGSFPDGYFGDPPWYTGGEKIEQVNKDKIEVYNGTVTSCDLDRPHYALTAKRLTIYPGDKVIARNVVFRILGRPVFWWPYYVLSLENREPPIEISPGHSRRFGLYVLTTKGIAINKYVSGKLHADWMNKRGYGAGLELTYNFEELFESNKLLGTGDIKTYAIKDHHSPNPLASSPFAEKNLMTEDRGRFSWRHRSQLDRYTDLKIHWHELSDEFFLRDFFLREFREEATPKSFITFTRNTQRYGLITEIVKRTNRFQGEAEKFPEVRFNWKTSEIADLGIYYQNEEVFSVLNSKTARSAEDTDVVRGHTFHQINYPRRFFRFDFNPFLNWEGTYWSKGVSKGFEDRKHIVRRTWGGGNEVTTRYFRIFDVKGSFLGIKADQIRHVIQPSFKYTFTRQVTLEDNKILQLDTIDTRNTGDVLTFGLENKIQTKRMVKGKIQRVDIVSLGTSLTYDMTHNIAGGAKWTGWGHSVQLRPYQWVSLEWTGTVDMIRDRWTNSNTDMIINYRNLYVIFGHRYLQESSSLVTMDVNYWLNARWAVGFYWRHEFDENQAQEVEVRLTRDLHDWLLDFGFNSKRNDSEDVHAHEAFIELTLKAYPKRSLKSGSRRTTARPRIGETVSGATSDYTVEQFLRGGYQTEETPISKQIK
ncbi:MAG: LPS-assembly protein LptD [Candidatus Omnitrophica bacterium]|nr:LPS-assembly protein LptD [Candidatus Omnitrophota bacterium]